ncbi:MAG: hypothetical protein U0840_05535 [Gemmataceae bacterium]
MDLQWYLVIVSAVLASMYLLRRSVQTWRGNCGGGCGCSGSKPSSAPLLIRAEDLTLRVKERSWKEPGQPGAVVERGK